MKIFRLGVVYIVSEYGKHSNNNVRITVHKSYVVRITGHHHQHMVPVKSTADELVTQ